ncbi:cytochrome B [Pseudoalteromonas luteoviolacea]|uniref:Cytochrome B n=1 Tax=Pseudoalteromonas luteoviolacea TaxID=43657 RepID=A0A1C0TRI5_9GAMM|nr:cytochrome b [Pseudoalteromonas luteoviolacea]OCQ21873.1 cytochrome B [Pseudoalteromonas luteoviolacea]
MTNTSFSLATRSLHWLVGITMLSLIIVGIYMANFEVWALYDIHKSMGVLALLLILPRVIYRLIQGFPEANSAHSQWEQKVSHLVHWVLLIGTLMMPVSGMLYSGFGGYGVDIFGLSLVSENVVDDSIVPYNESIFVISKASHWVIGYCLSAAILLHVAGAIKHHVIDKDDTLKRMTGKV